MEYIKINETEVLTKEKKTTYTTTDGLVFDKNCLRQATYHQQEIIKQELYKSGNLHTVDFLNGEFWNESTVPRDCPALVRLVEETGGLCVRDGRAVIAELPDDVEWEILSWDGGGESFEEKIGRAHV